MEEDKQIIENINGQPYTVELATNSKGQHQWVIKVSGKDMNNCLIEAMSVDDILQKKYGDERA